MFRRLRRSTCAAAISLPIALGTWALVPLVGVALTTLASETFTHPTVPSSTFQVPTVPSGTNAACLTAGPSAAATPIPGCALATPDADGSGALRFTAASGSQVGGVFSTTQLTTADAPDITFDSYQYGGNGADGISFDLAAAAPGSPAPPTTLGPAGGHLGYSGGGGAPSGSGLPNGWLGIGIDAWGNFSSTVYNGSGCTAPAWQPGVTTKNQVTVRGAGNGTVGYCAIASSLQGGGALAGNLSGGAAGTRASSRVPVEIAINPTGSALTSGGGVSVPAGSFIVSVTPIGGAKQTLTAALPSTSNGGIPAGTIPAADVNSATGYPYLFYAGWEGSTGGSFDVHEIRNFVATAMAGPSLTMAVSDSDGHNLPRGSVATYTLAAGIAAGGGSEGQSVTVTDVFPAGLTPTAASGTGWSCTVSAQTVSCTYAIVVSAPVAANTALPAITATVTVSPTASLAAGGLSDTATASSPDAVSVPATDTAQAVQTSPTFTASATPPSVAHGSASTLAATGLPNAATGTVTFTSNATPLCTATLPATTCTSPTTLPAAGYPVTATYSGDNVYTGATASTNLTVTQAPTSFTASATPSGVPYGSTSTLAVSGIPADATGAVTFTSGGTTLCTATLPAVSCTTSATLPAAGYPITATYPGDGNYTGSSANTSLTVSKAPDPFTASATPPSVPYGTSSTLAESGLPAGATGVVTFTSGATTLCSATLPAKSCTTATSLPAAVYPVTATYPGDGNHAGGTAGTSLTVTAAPTSFTASATPATVVYGTASTLAATGLPAAATGTITFTAGATTLCTATLPATTCATPASLAAAVYAVTAVYSGDVNHAGSQAATALTVTPAPTVTTVTSSQNPAGPNQAVTYTALVAPHPGAGTVAFLDNGAVISGCSAVPIDPVSGQATCTTAYPAAGQHLITADYSGSANFQPSASDAGGTAALAETVLPAVPVPATGDGGGGPALAAWLALGLCGSVLGGASALRRRWSRGDAA